jgi:hypothetical protein
MLFIGSPLTGSLDFNAFRIISSDGASCAQAEAKTARRKRGIRHETVDAVLHRDFIVSTSLWYEKNNICDYRRLKWLADTPG